MQKSTQSWLLRISAGSNVAHYRHRNSRNSTRCWIYRAKITTELTFETIRGESRCKCTALTTRSPLKIWRVTAAGPPATMSTTCKLPSIFAMCIPAVHGKREKKKITQYIYHSFQCVCHSICPQLVNCTPYSQFAYPLFMEKKGRKKILLFDKWTICKLNYGPHILKTPEPTFLRISTSRYAYSKKKLRESFRNMHAR